MTEGLSTLEDARAKNIWSTLARFCMATVCVALAGLLVGHVASGLPTRLRMLWGLAVLCGVVAAFAAVHIAQFFRVRGRWVVALLAVAGAVAAFGNYCRVSVQEFALLEAVESDESKAARMFLKRLPDDGGSDNFLDPQQRWAQWRAKGLGRLEGAWPMIVLLSELCACVLAAGIAGTLLAGKAGSNAETQVVEPSAVIE